MGYYPVFIQMDGRRCLVIGGGAVAEGKVEGLLAAGAAVTVVAPELLEGLRDLFAIGRIDWQQRAYAAGDLAGYEVCMVATDDGAVNAAVAAEGKRSGIWVNAADDPANCDFILPSVVRQGSIVVAASTGGGSPALARRLREELTDFLTDDYAALGDLIGEVRRELRDKKISVDAEVWQSAIDARLRALLAQRRPDEAREHLLAGLGVTKAVAGARS